MFFENNLKHFFYQIVHCALAKEEAKLGAPKSSKFCIKIGSAGQDVRRHSVRDTARHRTPASHFGMHIFMSDVIEETKGMARRVFRLSFGGRSFGGVCLARDPL